MVEQEEAVVARQRLGEHVVAATNQLLEAVFSARSLSRLARASSSLPDGHSCQSCCIVSSRYLATTNRKLNVL
jgi:hypothetical protein